MSSLEIIILSNTCVGTNVYNKLFNKEYNNPFIATLIPNDMDFIKLCNNINYYLTILPVLGNPRHDTLFAIQNNGQWYKHTYIKTPYPVLFLDDIEIHCIHEEDADICIDKFKRRLLRMKEIIETKPYKIISLLSFSEFLNDHEDTQSVIDLYLSNSHNVFIGPSKYKKTENYLVNKEWDDIQLMRNSSHIYTFNNQELLTDLLHTYIMTL